jgi:hypothetical protein
LRFVLYPSAAFFLRYHEKRGGFPEHLGKLEGVVWKSKERLFSIKKEPSNIIITIITTPAFLTINSHYGRFQQEMPAKISQPGL